MAVFKPYGFQVELLRSDSPITLAATGIQAGKTTAGALWMKIQMHKYTASNDNFLVTAPTYKILQQSTLPPMLRFLDGLGTYHRQDQMFTFYKGGNCYFRTGTDPDSIVGITNIRAVYGDEAGLYSLYFWENIQARAAFKNAKILLTTSPYSLNWVYKELIRPKMKSHDARPDVLYLKARSVDNPHFSKEYYERMRNSMDERRFRAMFGGEWEKMDGLVYNCFDEDENSCHPFELPPGSKYYAGIDWGTTAPFVFQVRGITPDGNHYQICEVYKTGLGITDMIAIAKQKMQQYPIQQIFCDPSGAGYILEFNRAGLPATPANNDIKVGIDLHYELIRTRRFKLFRGDNKHSVDEYESYHFPADKEVKEDTKVVDNLPVKQDDHCVDTSRYISAGTFTGTHRKLAEIHRPDEDRKLTIEERMARIRETPRDVGGW
jgi:PBSX family phage terminase large subunit